MKKNKIFKIAIILYFSIVGNMFFYAQTFDFKSHKNASIASYSMPYRLFVPDSYDPNKTYPLVLFLHGAGERGTDNTIQVDGSRGARLWAEAVNQAAHPCFVLAPQCPADKQWVNTSWSIGSYSTGKVAMSAELKMVKDIIDSLMKSYKIDVNQLYITGLSMGGYGTWDFIVRYPDMFRAAIPICGAGDPTKAASIKNVNIWCFHSSDDGTVPVSGTRDMVNALNTVGGNVKYTEYNDWGHSSWVPAYDNSGLVNWLFTDSVKQNNSIQVSLVSPTPNSFVFQDSELIIQANASSNSTGIQKVQFFANLTLLGEDSTAPYSFNWANTPAGLYSLTVKAIDLNGVSKTSKSTQIVIGNGKPIVSLQLPADPYFTINSNVPLKAEAYDYNGSVNKVEFYLNDNLIGTDASAPYSFTISNPTEGKPKIKVAATDNDGNVTFTDPFEINVLGYLQPQNPTQVSLGLRYEYYEGVYSIIPDLSTVYSQASGVVANFDLTPRLKNDYFAFVFTGLINIPESGMYTFYTSSDDGSKLYIDGYEVVNNDGAHGVNEASGSIPLAAGMHKIVVPFFEIGGGEVLEVRYKGPNTQKQIIPGSMLFYDSSQIAVTGITLNSNIYKINLGASNIKRQLTTNVYPKNATDKSIIWLSSDTTIATVDSTGLITGKHAGVVTITAKTSNPDITASCVVILTGSINLVNQTINRLEIKVYPNPLKQGDLYVEMSQNDKYVIQMYNVAGKKVIDKTIDSDRCVIQHKRLKPGVYLLNIGNGKRMNSQKIIVE